MDEFETEDDAVKYSVLGIRMPEEQREKIREAAKLEERSEAGFARYHLTRIAETVIAESQAQAAEPKKEGQPA
jgi:uncharacterized protein (DUF1778 family)